MQKQRPSKKQKQSQPGMIIGRERFAAISAVEGIKLTPEMERRVAEFDRKGLTPEERIRAIVAAHRKG
jgi:hypothetical protein